MGSPLLPDKAHLILVSAAIARSIRGHIDALAAMSVSLSTVTLKGISEQGTRNHRQRDTIVPLASAIGLVSGERADLPGRTAFNGTSGRTHERAPADGSVLRMTRLAHGRKTGMKHW